MSSCCSASQAQCIDFCLIKENFKNNLEKSIKMFFAHRKNYRKLLRFLCALPNISQIFAVFFMQCKKYCKNMRNFCGFFCAPQNILQIFAVFFTQRLETI